MIHFTKAFQPSLALVFIFLSILHSLIYVIYTRETFKQTAKFEMMRYINLHINRDKHTIISFFVYESDNICRICIFYVRQEAKFYSEESHPFKPDSCPTHAHSNVFHSPNCLLSGRLSMINIRSAAVSFVY